MFENYKQNNKKTFKYNESKKFTTEEGVSSYYE